MTELPTRLIIILFVLAGLFVIALLLGVGIYIGEWGEYDRGRKDEKEAQQYADDHLIVPRHEDGSFHVPNGDQIVIVGKTEVLPAEILVNRKALEDEFVTDPRYRHTGSPGTDASERSDEWGKTTTYTFSPER